MQNLSGKVISTILKHDNKQTSYKIALIRAINDIVLSFPDIGSYSRDVAIPVRMLAEFWVAYFWTFMDEDHPIMQGNRTQRNNKLTNDLSFRQELTYFRQLWEIEWGGISNPSDGFFIINELRIPRKLKSYPAHLIQAYQKTISKVSHALEQPIRYAGPGEWSVFEKPQRLDALSSDIIPIPGARANDLCLVAKAGLWEGFRELSLWIEALCIHEWCLFTEKVTVEGDRGAIYKLLTSRPDNRRPLTWERNRVDILLMEGKDFICPWTEKPIRQNTAYDMDHLIPVSIYPINELWNLIPSDPKFNMHIKRNRVPSSERIQRAIPHLEYTYQQYLTSHDLAKALCEDIEIRFSGLGCLQSNLTTRITVATVNFIHEVTTARNLEEF